MNATKILFFYIFLIAALINTTLMYVSAPLGNLSTLSMMLITLGVLAFSGLLTTIALASTRRVHMKTCFRIQLVILLLLVIVSVVARVLEAFSMTLDTMFIWRTIATLLYFMVFLFTIGLSKDVFKRLLEIHKSSN